MEDERKTGRRDFFKRVGGVLAFLPFIKSTAPLETIGEYAGPLKRMTAIYGRREQGMAVFDDRRIVMGNFPDGNGLCGMAQSPDILPVVGFSSMDLFPSEGFGVLCIYVTPMGVCEGPYSHLRLYVQ